MQVATRSEGIGDPSPQMPCLETNTLSSEQGEEDGTGNLECPMVKIQNRKWWFHLFMIVCLSLLWPCRSPLFTTFKSQRSPILLYFPSTSYICTFPAFRKCAVVMGVTACAHFSFFSHSLVLLPPTGVIPVQPLVSSLLTYQISLLTRLLGSYREFCSSCQDRCFVIGTFSFFLGSTVISCHLFPPHFFLPLNLYTHFSYWHVSTPRSGFFNHGVIDSLGQRILHCEWWIRSLYSQRILSMGVALCIAGCLAASLTSTYYIVVASPSRTASILYQYQYLLGSKTCLCWHPLLWVNGVTHAIGKLRIKILAPLLVVSVLL